MVYYPALWLGAVIGLASATAASAQANCGAARTPQMRAWCYQQQAEIYRQQQQTYNDIARQQYRQHQRWGEALEFYGTVRGPHTPDGFAAGMAGRAWNAPRYYYDYRYGRP